MADFLAGLGATCSPAGSIRISTFICLDPVQPDIWQFRQASSSTSQASSTDIAIGISQQGTDNAPNLQNALYGGGTTTYTQYAAQPGEPVAAFGLGDICPLVLGSGGASAGALLTWDASGQGIMTAWGSGQPVGAQALQPGNAGDIISVQVQLRRA